MANKSSVPEIANEFSKVLRSWLTSDEMAKANRRNDVESDRNTCHSHDFCDANMAMFEAMENLGLKKLANSAGESDEATKIWTEAWDLAKKNRFKVMVVGRKKVQA